MEAIGYIRKSTKDQSHYSLEYQENAIRRYCSHNEVELGAVYVDDGESSYTFDRPDYRALETFIKQQRGKVRYLVVLDHDRFSRNLPEALMKIEELEKKHRLKVVATNESLDIDTSDPSVFMMRAFKYLIANQELFTIRRRAKLAIRQARESGRFVNNAPYGYTNIREQATKKGMIIVNETEAYVVKKIFRDYLSGIPAYLIHQSAKSMGFPLNGSDAITRVLRNCLYAGLVKVTATEKEPERLVKGIHEAIVSEEQYWRAQEMLDDKRSEKPQPKKEFPLRGILRSNCCGGHMTAWFSKGKKKYYLYYRCVKHSSVNISGNVLHDRYEELLKHLSYTKEQVTELIGYIKDELKIAVKVRKKELESKKALLLIAEKKLDGLEDKVLNDIINGDTYKKGYKKFSIEIARLKSEVSDLSVDINKKAQEQIKLIPKLLNVPELFKRATINQQHSFLNRVFKGGLTFDKGTFRTPELNPVFHHNYLIMKQKGLLEVEQPIGNLTQIPNCGE
jgi:site-specific DNA recombinase